MEMKIFPDVGNEHTDQVVIIPLFGTWQFGCYNLLVSEDIYFLPLFFQPLYDWYKPNLSTFLSSSHSPTRLCKNVHLKQVAGLFHAKQNILYPFPAFRCVNM